MKPVTVYTTFDSADAQLVHSRLEAAGFDAEVVHEAAALTGPSTVTTQGILIQVPEDQAEDARNLINAPSEDKGQ